jgi:hypothetical protein
MKKVFLTVAIAFLGIGMVSAQFHLGVRAGLNAANISGITEDFGLEETDGSLNSPLKMGLNAGIVAQYMISEQFGLESGLAFSQLGAKRILKEEELGYYIKETLTLSPYYLQLPVTALYKFNLGEDLYLYPSAGLYFGYGLGGKVKAHPETNIPVELLGNEFEDYFEDYEEDFFPKGHSENINRFDFGLTAGVTLQYSKFTIGLGYDFGLTKINKFSDGETGMRNSNLKVTLGYFIF